MVGDRFEHGVAFCLDGATWAKMLPFFASSPWKSRIAHESHRWVAVGGVPEDILRAVDSWGFDGLPFRRWSLLHHALGTYMSVQLGTITKDASNFDAHQLVTADNVAPELTVEDVRQLCSAAGVQPRSIVFTIGSATTGRQVQLQLSDSDSARLCRRPIRWNKTMILRFTFSVSSSAGGAQSPRGSADPTPGGEDVPMTDKEIILKQRPASYDPEPGPATPQRRRHRADSMRPPRTRNRDRQGSGKQARNKGKLQSGSDALQRTLCQDDCAGSTDAAASFGSEGSIDMSVDLTPFPDANAPWEAGGFVIAPRPGESQRGLMHLIAKTPEGEWRAELVQPYIRCRATVKEAPKHKQGPGFLVQAPRERPPDMPATRWFFEKTYGNFGTFGS